MQGSCTRSAGGINLFLHVTIDTLYIHFNSVFCCLPGVIVMYCKIKAGPQEI